MAGDGINVAIESADVTLVKGDLRGIVKAVQLSRLTVRNIRQNLFFAFIYNMLGVPIAAGILYPIFGILLSPMLAAAAMSFSSVSVASNALRLRTSRLGWDVATDDTNHLRRTWQMKRMKLNRDFVSSLVAPVYRVAPGT